MVSAIESLPKAQVGGVPFAQATLSEASDAIVAAAHEGRGQSIRFANAYCVVMTSQDPAYASLLRESGTNFADGAPVAHLLGRRNGRDSSMHVRGPSCFVEVLRSTEGSGLRHYFVAPDEQTATELLAKIAADFPGVEIAGYSVPPFLPVEQLLEACASSLEEVECDIVWIGLGSPKQDQLSTALAQAFPRVFLGVGAALSFYAGTVAEAPEWMRRVRLEWLFRFLSEPRRLWRRYLLGNARFVWLTRRDWQTAGEVPLA